MMTGFLFFNIILKNIQNLLGNPREHENKNQMNFSPNISKSVEDFQNFLADLELK